MLFPKRIVLSSKSRRPGDVVEAVTEQQAAIDLRQRSALRNFAELCCRTVVIEGDDYVLHELDGKEAFRGSRAGAIASLYDMSYDLDVQEYVDMARDELVVEDAQLSLEYLLTCGAR